MKNRLAKALLLIKLILIIALNWNISEIAVDMINEGKTEIGIIVFIINTFLSFFMTEYAIRAYSKHTKENQK